MSYLLSEILKTDCSDMSIDRVLQRYSTVQFQEEAQEYHRHMEIVYQKQKKDIAEWEASRNDPSEGITYMPDGQIIMEGK